MSAVRQFTLGCGLVVLLLAVCQTKDLPLRWPFNVNTTQQMPLQQWQSQQQYQQQSGQQQPTQQMLYTAQQRQQIQQMQRQQQRLATEVTDLRKPSNYNNVNYNNIPPPPQQQQQQPAQVPTQFNTRQPNSYPYHYNNYNYNNNRVPQLQGHMPRQLPANYSYPQYGVAPKNSSTEQFEKFDPSQRNARTFGFISDIINSFSSSPCVNPCTIEAYSQNRCCIVVVNPEPPVCCQYPMPRPQPPIMPPIPMPPPPPPPPPMYPVRPPISCCSACSYGYFGPPPCGYYGGSGVIRRGGGLFGSGGLFGGGGFIGSNPGGLYLGGNVGNLGGGQFSLSVPQTSIFG